MARVDLSRRKKLLFAVLVTMSVLLGAEVGLRFSGLKPARIPRPGESVFPLDAFGYFAVCDQHFGFRNRVNGCYRAQLFEDRPLCTTDELGYRCGVGWSAKGTTPVVAFVGDSHTFSSEVNDDQTPASEVARLLAGKFDVRVLNAGVRGYSALQVKRMLAECLERFPRVPVAVYTHCGNDLEHAMISWANYPAMAPIIEIDPVTRAFREQEVTRPMVPWGECFLSLSPPATPPSCWARGAAWCRARSSLIHHSLAGLERFGRTRPPPPPPQVITSLPGVSDDQSQWHDWALDHGGASIMVHLLTQMKKICDDHGTEFLATSVYTGRDPATPTEFEQWCSTAGVRYVSLVEHFHEAPEAYLALRADGRRDAHYGSQGAKTYAAVLAPVIEELLRRKEVPSR